jgi:hypothetical protein
MIACSSTSRRLLKEWALQDDMRSAFAATADESRRRSRKIFEKQRTSAASPSKRFWLFGIGPGRETHHVLAAVALMHRNCWR